MANLEHLKILKQGVEIWNNWRIENPDIKPDLKGIEFEGAKLENINLSHANLSEANLKRTNLAKANLVEVNLMWAENYQTNLEGAILMGAKLEGAGFSEANFKYANLFGANLSRANLIGANLEGAYLNGANLNEALLSQANLSKADLNWANLEGATLIEANLDGTNLQMAILNNSNMEDAVIRNCEIYGVSSWNISGHPKEQKDIILKAPGMPFLVVDNINVAQFLYLFLEKKEIRGLIDTLTLNAVLILGHFTPERKPILDSLRELLREKGYLPIFFDFYTPTIHDLKETLMPIAGISRFVIADLTAAKAIPQKLSRVMSHYNSVPIMPFVLSSEFENDKFIYWKRKPYVIKTYLYPSEKVLLANLEKKIIEPAEQKAIELKQTKK